MRHFHSYGPVDCRRHFCVPRTELIEHCTEQLIVDPKEGGHYFTIWAPRQNGKTWLMHQVIKRVQEKYGHDFECIALSMQSLIMNEQDSDEVFFRYVPLLFEKSGVSEIPEPSGWNAWTRLFGKRRGIFNRPVFMFIDEFDSLPPKIIDKLVTL